MSNLLTRILNINIKLHLRGTFTKFNGEPQKIIVQCQLFAVD